MHSSATLHRDNEARTLESLEIERIAEGPLRSLFAGSGIGEGGRVVCYASSRRRELLLWSEDGPALVVGPQAAGLIRIRRCFGRIRRRRAAKLSAAAG